MIHFLLLTNMLKISLFALWLQYFSKTICPRFFAIFLKSDMAFNFSKCDKNMFE